jgi:hypothetical protein
MSVEPIPVLERLLAFAVQADEGSDGNVKRRNWR